MSSPPIIRLFVAATCATTVGAIIVWGSQRGKSNGDKIWARELLEHWKEQENKNDVDKYRR